MAQAFCWGPYAFGQCRTASPGPRLQAQIADPPDAADLAMGFQSSNSSQGASLEGGGNDRNRSRTWWAGVKSKRGAFNFAFLDHCKFES